MNHHSELLLQEYTDLQPAYHFIYDFVLNKIKYFLAEKDILITAVEGRIKSKNSLAGKLELKGEKYHSILDITDIVGLRVITFYDFQVDKVASILEKNFHIDWENSVDKRKIHALDSFGYMSLHYICSIPETMYKDENHPEYNQIRFEIQMRTALQHVWANAQHDTGYKNNVEIPKEYKRAMSRLAGILEIADKEFTEIITELGEYKRAVISLTKDGKFDNLSIDGDSFKAYLDLKPFAKLNGRIASVNNAEIQSAGFMNFLSVFEYMGFDTLKDVEDLKNNYSEDAFRLAVLQIGGTDLDILSENIGLKNLCLVWAVKNGFGEKGIKDILDMLNGEKAGNSKSAKRIINQAKSINISPENL